MKSPSILQQSIIPSTVLAQSILQRNLFSQLFHVIVSLALITNGIIGLYEIIYEPLSQTKSTSHIARYAIIWNKAYMVFFGLVISLYIFNRFWYIKFLDSLSNGNDQYQSISDLFIKEKSKRVRYTAIYSILFELFLHFGDSQHSYEPINISKGYGKLGRIIFHQIISLLTLLGWTSFLQFIVETCLYLHSAFIVIDSRLEQLDFKTITNDHIEKQVQSIRLAHLKALETTSLVNKFYSLTILSFYTYFVGYCLFIFGITLNEIGSVSSFSIIFVRFIGESIYLILITYHFIKVNLISNKIFDKVYFLSFSIIKSDKLEFNNEINLFLQRIARYDVGFTFAGLAYITPSFVSSLATIALTLGLALPGIFGEFSRS